MFVFVDITFYSFALSAGKAPLVSALEFRCSFPQRLQRLSLSSSSRSNGKRANLFKNRDFNGENFLSLSAAFPYDPFRSMAKN